MFMRNKWFGVFYVVLATAFFTPIGHATDPARPISKPTVLTAKPGGEASNGDVSVTNGSESEKNITISPGKAVDGQQTESTVKVGSDCDFGITGIDQFDINGKESTDVVVVSEGSDGTVTGTGGDVELMKGGCDVTVTNNGQVGGSPINVKFPGDMIVQVYPGNSVVFHTN